MSSAPRFADRFPLSLLAVTLMVMAGVSSSFAQSLYWDVNGPTAGAGGTSPSGVWDLLNARWNDVAGTGTPALWTNSGLERAVFSAGADATGAYVVTLGSGAALKLAGVTVNAGLVTLLPQTAADSLNFGTLAASLDVASGASLLLQADTAGSGGLIKTGTGLLELDAAVTPTGAYAIQAGELRIASGRTVSTGALTLGGAAGVSSTLTLASGSVLNLGSDVTFSFTNTPLAGLIQGAGTLNLNGTRAFTIQNLATDPDLTVETVIADGNAVSGLSKAGGGTLLLKGASTYTGTTTVNAGTLLVQGNQASIAASSGLSIGGAAVVTLGDVADTVAVDRVGNLTPVNLTADADGGATLNYNGANLVVAGTHVESAGVLTLEGDNRSVITLQAGAGDQVELRFSSLTRTGNAVGLVRGSALGAATGTADSSRVFFETAPTLTGGILPWLLVDATTAGVGTAFATYDATNGLTALTNTVSPASATTGSNVLKSTNGNITLNSSVAVNSWTTSSTGTTTLGSGVKVSLSSGGLLFTNTATFTAGSLDFGSINTGIIHLARNGALTATINSALTGTLGLILSGSGTGAKTLILGADSTVTGGISVYSGVLSVNHAGALNASGVNALAVQAGGTVRLNGFSPTVSGLSGAGTVNSNSGTSTAVLTVNGGGTFTGTLVNGTEGTLALTKTGTTTLVLGGVNTYTGPTVVRNGVLNINATGANPGTNGRLTATSSVQVLQGATLRINKGNGAGNSNHADRLNDAAPITLSGGTLNFSVNGNNIIYSETVGVVNLTPAASQITSGQAGETGTSTLLLSGLTWSTGATLNFTGTGLGTSVRNRLEITGNSAGFLGGWATVGNDFAKYVTDVDGTVAGDQSSVTAFVAADYLTTNANDATTPWTSASHVKPIVDQGTAQGLSSSRDVSSVNLGGGIDLTLGSGTTLTLVSGGVIKQGGSANGTGTNASQITGGTLTAGGSAAAAELFVRVTGANFTVGSVIANNAAGGQVALVKGGAGTLNVTAANTFTGGVFLNEGTLGANNTTGSATGTGSIVSSLGSILGGTGFISPAANASITLNGTLSVGNLNDTVARDLAISVSGTGALSINNIVLLDLFTNAGTGTLNPLTGADLLDVNAPSWTSLQLGSSSTLKVVTSLTATGFVAGDSWQLFDWSGIADGTAPVQGQNGFALLDLPALAAGLQWDTSKLFTTGVITVMVPEPGRLVLLFTGLAFVFLRRRQGSK